MGRKINKIEERNKFLLNKTLGFSEATIQLTSELPKNIVNAPLISQLIKSATSIGANYREACEAESSKDFVHKIKISIKEARETKYWLKLLLKTNSSFEKQIIYLGKESIEFVKIFSSIISKFKK